MRNINKKGFTLIELLAVLMLLALVTGIGSYSIISIINNTKESDYKLLIENINSAVEEYYIECKYDDLSSVTCPSLNSDEYQIKLGDLVKYGYLKGNSTLDDDTATLVNPKDKEDISNCKISYSYENNEIKISAVSPEIKKSCPDIY